MGIVLVLREYDMASVWWIRDYCGRIQLLWCE